MSRFRYVKHFSVLVAMSLFMIFNIQNSSIAQVTSTIFEDSGVNSYNVAYYQFGNNWFYPVTGGWDPSNSPPNTAPYRYTDNSGISGTAERSWWTTQLSGTNCETWVYIPAQYDATLEARYHFYEYNTAYYRLWVVNQVNPIGNYRPWIEIDPVRYNGFFCNKPLVYLPDNTGEYPGTHAVLYDAVGIYFPHLIIP